MSPQTIIYAILLPAAITAIAFPFLLYFKPWKARPNPGEVWSWESTSDLDVFVLDVRGGVVSYYFVDNARDFPNGNHAVLTYDVVDFTRNRNRVDNHPHLEWRKTHRVALKGIQ